PPCQPPCQSARTSCGNSITSAKPRPKTVSCEACLTTITVSLGGYRTDSHQEMERARTRRQSHRSRAMTKLRAATCPRTAAPKYFGAETCGAAEDDQPQGPVRRCCEPAEGPVPDERGRLGCSHAVGAARSAPWPISAAIASRRAIRASVEG